MSREREVDEALALVGGYRRWHVCALTLLAATTSIAVSWQQLGIVFIGWTPPHQCVSSEMKINGTNDTIDIISSGSQCTVNYAFLTNESWENVTAKCENGWAYNTYYKTIVTDWNLVCEDNYLSELSQTLFNIVGMATTAPVAYMVDRFGRKRMHVIGGVMLALTGAGVAYIPNLMAFMLLRSMTHALVRCVGHSGTILTLEMVDSEKRTVVGLAREFGWMASCVLLPFIAYCFSDWRHFQITISLASGLCILHVWYLLEAPAWLAAKGKYTEAEEVLNQMAKWNNVNAEHIKLKKKKQSERLTTNVRPIVLVTDKYLRIHLVIASLLWFTNMLIYFGISYITPSLGINRFHSFFVISISELPAYIAVLPLLKRFGRRIPLCALHIIAGTALAILAFIPSYSTQVGDLSWLPLCLTMVGKFGITGTFAIMIIFCHELFPTNVRGTALGIYTLVADIGGMIAPFANYAGKLQVMWLLYLVFAGLALLTGLLVLLLPETSNLPLPDTLTDIHRLYQEETDNTIITISVRKISN